jgi:predicted DNA-binding protein
MRVITFRIPDHVDRFLRVQAEKYGTTKSYYLRQALAGLIEEAEFSPHQMARALRRTGWRPSDIFEEKHTG